MDVDLVVHGDPFRRRHCIIPYTNASRWEHDHDVAHERYRGDARAGRAHPSDRRCRRSHRRAAGRVVEPVAGQVPRRRTAHRVPPDRHAEARRRHATSRSPAPKAPTSRGGSTRTTVTRSSGSSPRPATRPTRSRCAGITYERDAPRLLAACPTGSPTWTSIGVAGAAVLPELPALRGPDLPLGQGPRRWPLLCVRAYNDWMVEEWCGEQRRPADPALPRPAVGRRARRRRGPAQRRTWCARRRLHRAARLPRSAEPRTPATGTRSSLPARRPRPSLCMHIGSGTKTPQTSPDAPEAVRRHDHLRQQRGQHDRLPVLRRASTAIPGLQADVRRSARSAGSRTCSSGSTTSGTPTGLEQRPAVLPGAAVDVLLPPGLQLLLQGRGRRRDARPGRESTTSCSRPTTRTRTAPGRTRGRRRREQFGFLSQPEIDKIARDNAIELLGLQLARAGS